MTVLIGDRKIRIPKPKLLIYDDYAKLTPPDNGNYELHKGQIIFMPTPIPKHQEISGKLHYLLFGFTLSHKNGKVYAAPMDTELHLMIRCNLIFCLFLKKGNLLLVKKRLRAHLIL